MELSGVRRRCIGAFCKNVWIALHPCGKLRCIYFTCVGDRDAALYRAAGECQTAGQLQIQLERYQNILDYTHDAIIAVDETGRISVTNQIAEQMLRPARPPFAGRLIEDVLANTQLTSVLKSGEAEIGQMMNIHGTLVSTNRVPIRVGGKIKGVVATFQDIKTLQKAERNIRIKLHEKG